MGYHGYGSGLAGDTPGLPVLLPTEDVGHSDEARALLPGMLVGGFEQDSVRITPPFYNFIPFA